jgi:WhiB family redox-sensing transcriptional regulator
MDWRHRAACLSEEADLFFPIGSSDSAYQQIEQAKAVCQRCDVRAECLEWALKVGQDHGVWGGLSADERDSLRRRIRRERATIRGTRN